MLRICWQFTKVVGLRQARLQEHKSCNCSGTFLHVLFFEVKLARVALRFVPIWPFAPLWFIPRSSHYVFCWVVPTVLWIWSRDQKSRACISSRETQIFMEACVHCLSVFLHSRDANQLLTVDILTAIKTKWVHMKTLLAFVGMKAACKYRCQLTPKCVERRE